MKKQAVFLVFVIFALFFFSHLAAGAAAPASRVVITFGSFSEREGALFVADDQGFFRKYGLDIKLVHVLGIPYQNTALLGTTNENIRRLKAEDLIDDRFVKKLEQEGGF
jgi:hypothetical protein